MLTFSPLCGDKDRCPHHCHRRPSYCNRGTGKDFIQHRHYALGLLKAGLAGEHHVVDCNHRAAPEK